MELGRVLFVDVNSLGQISAPNLVLALTTLLIIFTAFLHLQPAIYMTFLKYIFLSKYQESTRAKFWPNRKARCAVSQH
jgi:hypothetical protein